MNQELPKARRIALLTLGCAKNEADSRAMQQRLEAQGLVVGDDPAEASLILLNTCAFIEAAIEESLETILELAALDEVKSGATKLVVAGCLPSRFGDELMPELPEVAAFVPVADEMRVVKTIKELLDLEDHPSADTPSGHEAVSAAEQVEQPWAYVKISDGCSRRCSFCTIPTIRGPYQSYSFSHIDTEVSRLIAAGVKEIVLIGQDTGIWSEPTEQGASGQSYQSSVPASATAEDPALNDAAPNNLAELLAALASRYPDTWFRVMYLQPEGINDALLEVMATHSNIARYLDIPLQHANARLLRAMNRRGSGEEYLEMLKDIREKVPGVALRTTVIVGFPGETRSDFQELQGFIEAARFDFVGIFAYSREPGTVAYDLDKQVSHKTALLRVQALRDLADGIGFEQAQNQIDKEVELLVCGSDEEGLYGRTKGQAPDVDGITYLHSAGQDEAAANVDNMPRPGMLVHARITESVLYDLYAEAL